MPTQAKKAASTHPNEKSTKIKKKKKKESAKAGRKDSHSGSDSTAEGRHHKKSKSKKDGSQGSNSISSDSGRYPASSSQEESSRSFRASSTDGRSTSSSGENTGVSYPTSSSPESDCSRISEDRESNVNSTSAKAINESLRWDAELDDTRGEEERIRLYKINRRKRYLAVVQPASNDDIYSQFYA